MALSKLQKSKYLEAEMIKKQEIVNNLESIISQIESSLLDAELISAYRLGNEALKENSVSIEEIDRLYEDIKENISKNEIISQSLAQSPIINDDHALEAELNLLIKEESEVEELISQVEALDVIKTSIDENQLVDLSSNRETPVAVAQ